MIQEEARTAWKVGGYAERQPLETVETWTKRILDARDVTHRAAFDRMHRARHWATWGCDPDWLAANKYRANVLGRHINVKVASLFARSPRVVCRPKQKLLARLWDGRAASIADAMARAQQAAMVGMRDPAAEALLAEWQQVEAQKALSERICRTIETLIQHWWDQDFRRGIKQAVRMALTCGVAYCRGEVVGVDSRDPHVLAQVADARSQLALIEAEMATLAADAQKLADLEKRRLELQETIDGLVGRARVQPERVVWSFPDPWAIIPDPRCRRLMGFEGARWVAEQFFMDREEIYAAYGVDVGTQWVGYRADRYDRWFRNTTEGADRYADLICVWEVWDRRRRMVFTIADGYPGYLEAPHEPVTAGRDFWPWEALVFNEQELPRSELYPPSEVDTLLEIQDEINQQRQGLREHRRAKRPLWVTERNAFTDDEARDLASRPPFSVVPIQALANKKISDLLQAVPTQPIDPAVYDPTPLRIDMMLVAGSQDADLGPTSGATATEVATAASARQREMSEDIDSVDDFLTRLAQSLLHRMPLQLSPETVERIVGPGAAWPVADPWLVVDDYEVCLVAGSSGRPNKAQEIANMERVLPFLLQMPAIDPVWLAEQTLRRLDEDLDLASAISPSTPSIVAINAMAKAPPPSEAPPQAQGDAGSENEERPLATAPGPQPAMGASGALPPGIGV